MSGKFRKKGNCPAARRLAIVFAVFAAVVLAVSPPLRAQIFWSNTSSGDWSIGSNWGGTVPTGSDAAYVVNGGTVNITQPGETCGTLSLGGSAGSGAIQMTGGSLTTRNFEYVGDSGGGSFTQTGGTNSIGINFYLGAGSSGSGEYSLSGNALLSASTEFVGFSGTGDFVQTGGTNQAGRNLYLGANSGGSGGYSLGGSGLLRATFQYVGSSGTGVFVQTGGINSATVLSIGASGSYLLDGGTLNAIEGLLNQGEFSGGATPAALNAGGFLDLTSGTWQNMTNISLTMGTNSLLIVPAGLNPSTAFAPSSSFGMIHTAGTTLSVSAGQTLQGAGTINDPVVCQGSIGSAFAAPLYLNGGLVISGTGHVAMGMGNVTTNDLASGMSSGALSGSNQYVGSGGTGAFSQTGGGNQITNLYLGNNSGDSGAYSLTSGVVSSQFEYVGNSGSGSFTQSGGGNSFSVPSILSLYVGMNPGSNGSYGLSGSGQLSTGYEYIGYSGSGSFSQSGGNNIIANGNGGSSNLNQNLHLGMNPGSYGTYNLSGSGLVSTFIEYVGYSGSGSFAQSGGTNSVNYELDLGENAGSYGAYNLSGTAQLSITFEYIGQAGTGSFTQTGGIHYFGGFLDLGEGPGSAGIYNLSGTGRLQGLTEHVGDYGAGIFTQTGGTNSGGIELGVNPGSSGTYNLEGGLLSGGIGQGSGSATFNFSGGTLQATGGVLAIALPITLGTSSGGATFDTNGFVITLSGQLSSSGGLTKVNGGTLTLATGNNYLGTTTLGGGILSLANFSALAGGGNITFGGGTLQYSASNNRDYSGKIVGSSGPISIDTNGVNVMFASNLVGSNTGGLTKIGNGTLTLAAGNTYTGNTLVSGGTLALGSALALQDGNLDTNGSGYLSFGSLSAATLGGLTGPGTLSLINASSTAVALSVGNNNVTTTFSGSLQGGGSLNKIGSGILSLSGSNTYSGPTIIRSGVLMLEHPADGIGIHFIGNNSVNTAPFPGTGGVVSMSNWNNKSGFTFSGSTLANSKGQNIGVKFSVSGANSYWGTGSANQLLNGYISDSNFNPLSLTLANIPYAMYSLYVYVGDSSVGNQEEATINGTNYFYATEGAAPTYSAITSTNSASYQSGNFIAVDGLTGSSQTVRLVGTTQQYCGLCSVEIVNDAPVIDNTNILPAVTAVSIAANATLDLGGGSQQVASLSDIGFGSGGYVINSIFGTTSILTLSATSGSTTFSGTIQGGGTLGTIGLVMNGISTQVLAGSNTYTGPTTLSGGKLIVDGWLTNSAVSVNGGTLGGSGHLANVTVNPGGTLAPGDSPGVLHLSGNLTLQSGAAMDYELDGVSTDDEISLPSGILSLNNQQFDDFSFIPLPGFEGGTYDLIAFGTSTGGLGQTTTGTVGGFPAFLSMQGHDLVLTVVPEPSTAALLAAGTIGLFGYGSWRRRKTAKGMTSEEPKDDAQSLLSFPSHASTSSAARRSA